MAEVINEIIGKEAFAQIERMEKGLNGLVDTFVKSANAAKLMESVLGDTKGVTATTDAIKELNKEQQKNETILKKIAIAESEQGKIMAENAVRLQALNTANKNAARENLANEGSVNKLSASLIKYKLQWDAMSEALRKSPLGTEIQKRIQATDAALKQLDGSTGRFQRNVGDYKNQLFGLTQVFRELPGFTYSAQTGILGLSNNLPILADGFKAVAAATNETTGKVNGTMGAMKIFASSIFSFGNIFAIAIGLFTIFSKEIFAFFENTKKAVSIVDALTESFKRLDDEIAFNTKHLDNQSRLLIAAAKARGATQDELNKIEQSGMEKRLDLYDDEIKKQIEIGAGYRRVLTLKQAGAFGIKESLVDLQKVVDESDKKLLELQQKRADIAIDLQVNKYNATEKGRSIGGGKTKGNAATEAFTPNFKRDADIETTGREMKEYYEKLQKEQIKILGDLISDPESRQAFDEFLIGEVLAGDESVSDAKAQELADSIAAFYEKVAAKRAKDLKKKEDKDKEIENIQFVVEQVQVASNAISDITQLQYDREMARIDERNKALQFSYDQEKLQIEQSGFSKEEKAKRLANLEARKAAQDKQIERDRITAARKAAQYERALTIANIITTGALAVVKQEAATPLPAGAPFIALTIAGIAAQLARAVATPIPQYAKGTDNHKGGLAIVGEKGTELGILPSGKTFLTPATDTLMDLPAQTKIIPHEKLMQGLDNIVFKKLGNGDKVSTDSMQVAMLDAFSEMTNKMENIEKAIKKQKLGVNMYGDMEHLIRMKKIIS